MANVAIFWEIRGRVVWVGRARVVIGMAAITVSWNSLELLAFVAGSAIQMRMSSHQGKPGCLRMIKFRSLPSIYSMTTLTSERETRTAMVRRSRRLVILEMTGGTCSAQPCINARGTLRMAGIAVDRSMRPQQRKTVEMVPNRLHVHFPPFNGVTLLTAGAKLPPMNVGMASGTSSPHVAEQQASMASGTGNAFVQTAKRITRIMVMIELQLVPDGPPADGGMATLAYHLQRTVRVLLVGRV